MIGKRGANRRVGDRPPAESEDGRGRPVQKLQREPFLGRPEGRLSVLGEDALDRLAQLLLDHLIDVDRLDAEPSGDAQGRRRLAGAHEADAHDGAISGQGHPRRIASSG